MSDDHVTHEPEEAPPEEDTTPAPTPARGATRREAVLVGVLLLTVVLWGYDRYMQRSLQTDAAPLAAALLQENTTDSVEAVSQLTVSRDIPVFGTPLAKVEVFVRKAGADETSPIGGIEYNYAMEEGKWILKDSGGCTSEECNVRGRDAFAKK